MGPCEQSAEPACVSPRMFFADGVEELVDNVLGERLMECSVEPLSSFNISSPMADRGGDDSVVQFIDQQHCFSDPCGGLGELGMEDGNTTYNCPVPVANNSETSIERADLECAYGTEDICDVVGERLDELILEPLSGLDISLHASKEEQGSVLEFSSEEGFCELDHISGTLEGRDETAKDFCQSTTCTDTDFEPVIDRHDVQCEHADNNSELGSASSIKCCLNNICNDGGQCEHEMNSCLSNLTVDGRFLSVTQQVAGSPSGSATPYMSATKAGCGSSVPGSFAEAVCTGTVDNGTSKSLVVPDTFRTDDSDASPNFTRAIENFNHAGYTEKDNAGTEVDTCELKCLQTSSLPLRRSSRSRKSVQKVPRVKNATMCTKKATKVCQTPDLLSEATRKKRSSLSRSICSSDWGKLKNLSKYFQEFQQSNEISVNLMIDQRSSKKKAGQRNRKKNMLNVIASSQFSEGRKEVPYRPIRLKVTFGKKEEPSKVDGIAPVVVDAFPGFQPADSSKGLNSCSYIDSSGEHVKDSSVSKDKCSNSTSNVQFAGSNVEMCSESGRSSNEDSAQLDFEKRDSLCADKFSDPGTSPDSEVIDQLLGSVIGPMASCGNACPRSHSSPASKKKSKNKRYKKEKLCLAGNPALEYQHSADRAKISKKGGQLQKLVDDLRSINNINADSENPPSSTSGSELVLTDLLPVVDDGSRGAGDLDNGADTNAYSSLTIGIESANSGNSCELVPLNETQAKRNSKGSRTKGKPRNKSKITDVIRHQVEPFGQQKAKSKSTSKHKVMETGILSEAYKIKPRPGTGNQDMLDLGKTDVSNEVPLDIACCLDLSTTVVGKQTSAPRVAWVCCDECLKWRCIPAELADSIEQTNCRWTCKDNGDQAFADCSIPQEKSNAEINAELQISDEEDARDGHLGSKGSGLGQPVAFQPSTWMLIKSNLFLHRSRKAQTMDEVMVCHCKPPVNGRLGCGSQCLNRMLNIECVQGTCPCGDLCSNQLFQKKQYAMLSWFRCGKKGYGLQVLENTSEGKFLIEYVGEVLDLQSYEARQRDYAAKGHKHFYFMTLNGNEVIDASAKGNLGRFVNHSCDPNCRTEKWVVNGEICVGLFASRNIKKGEELTFDYNYVRVFGAAVKKCHCGSRKCRGYIGGDPLNSQVIVQGDSDEEFPEPVVIDENGEIDRSLEDMMAKSISQDAEQALNGDKLIEENSEDIVESGEMVNKIKYLTDDVDQSQTVPVKDTVNEVHESTDSLLGLDLKNLRNGPLSAIQSQTSRTEHTTSTPASSPESDILLVENTIQKSFSGSIDSNSRVSELDIKCELPHARPRSRMKISRPSKSVKNRKFSGNSANVGKALLTGHRSKILSHKSKKSLEGSANGHLEAVEAKLNELLDADGGICKKKDASKGYLKLLLLTAASGDSGNGGSIQSNRDLSMILDAMLKSKSRGVLLDIINKNGLQMLHNMMKLYRTDFKKIPILRKLLKVLEFLAEKEILTMEHINGDSLHPGVESLRESVLYFTNHKDNQVHQIARNFRDRWIPRKFNRMDRRREFRRGSNSNNRYFGTGHHWREQGAPDTERSITCSDQSVTITNPNPADDRMLQEASCSQLTDSQTTLTRPRKRKSRWDQPACPRSPKNIRTNPIVEIIEDFSKHENKVPDDETMQNSDEDDEAPPGFSYPLDPVNDSPPGFSTSAQCPSMGLLQERFNPRLPVAYGIPLSVIQKSGTLLCGTVDSWDIAPGMPFQPFPPLPPYPRRDRRQVAEQEEAREGYNGDQGVPSTSGASANLLHQQNTVATNPNVFQQGRFRNIPGNRYNRQKKWNNQKSRPPWLRNLDGWGFRGNYPPHPRNGSSEINTETVANELNDNHLADVNHSIEYAVLFETRQVHGIGEFETE
ncbi:histone-lysine N-methyltransferase ASHH2 isoform X2 [Spinacia oleracea]|uniref:Histone-lysine N-methyltransferase ASHH2 isoform X2 n=1 Tax=Spinacia oleracea TaxID=3562 RepID=A0A9R0I346_SPIOL|nr:histone-lysine N-methyltransferase ASHH2 isoform X2 [Spinacia oleracea]